MVEPVHAALQSAHPETTGRSCKFWREMAAKNAIRTKFVWGFPVSGRISGCKYSLFKHVISCYMLVWLLKWLWKRKRLQWGFASKLDIFLAEPLLRFQCHFTVCATREHDPNTTNIKEIRNIYRKQVTAQCLLWVSRKGTGKGTQGGEEEGSRRFCYLLVGLFLISGRVLLFDGSREISVHFHPVYAEVERPCQRPHALFWSCSQTWGEQFLSLLGQAGKVLLVFVIKVVVFWKSLVK